MRFKQTLDVPGIKEFLIVGGEYDGNYISWWKNQKQHIDLMTNDKTIYGRELYTTKQKKDLTTQEILTIAKAILTYITIKHKEDKQNLDGWHKRK